MQTLDAAVNPSSMTSVTLQIYAVHTDQRALDVLVLLRRSERLMHVHEAEQDMSGNTQKMISESSSVCVRGISTFNEQPGSVSSAAVSGLNRASFDSFGEITKGG